MQVLDGREEITEQKQIFFCLFLRIAVQLPWWYTANYANCFNLLHNANSCQTIPLFVELRFLPIIFQIKDSVAKEVRQEIYQELLANVTAQQTLPSRQHLQ